MPGKPKRPRPRSAPQGGSQTQIVPPKQTQPADASVANQDDFDRMTQFLTGRTPASSGDTHFAPGDTDVQPVDDVIPVDSAPPPVPQSPAAHKPKRPKPKSRPKPAPKPRAASGPAAATQLRSATADAVLGSLAETPDALVGSRYRIIRLIQRGGMGEVWLAADSQVGGRPVAIKRMNAESLAAPNASELVDRFLDELDTMTRLTHPACVAVTDQGQDANGPYIVMEYVPGPSRDVAGWDAPVPPPMTLESFVAECGIQSPREAIRLLQPLCEAVANAHGANILHRDIKPLNVLVNAAGGVKLIDFGLARADDAARRGQTQDGSGMVSFGYTSPEQERNAADVDARTDVYSLGGVLWFLLTGQNPSHYRKEDVQPELREIVDGALRRDREDRTASVAELLDQIGRVRMSGTAARAATPELTDTSITDSLRRFAERFQMSHKPGVCPACGHQHDPVPRREKERRFCAGCGAGLWLVCPTCAGRSTTTRRAKLIVPTWDRRCGRCSTDQLEGLATRFRDIAELIDGTNRLSAKEPGTIAKQVARIRDEVQNLPRLVGDDFLSGDLQNLLQAIEEHNEHLLSNSTNRESVEWEQTPDTPDALRAFLKKYPDGEHFKEAAERLSYHELEVEIGKRIEAKQFKGLAKEVVRLLDNRPELAEKWPEKRLWQLVRRDRQPESIRAFLRRFPESRGHKAISEILSPYLRGALLADPGNTALRQEYLSVRGESEEQADRARSQLFHAVWPLSASLPVVVTLIAQNGVNPTAIISTVGAGCAVAIASILLGRHERLGPLPAFAYTLPRALLGGSYQRPPKPRQPAADATAPADKPAPADQPDPVTL